MAILDGKIDVGRGDYKAYYANGGGLICSFSKTEEPVVALTNLALQQTKDGKAFKEQLDNLIT